MKQAGLKILKKYWGYSQFRDLQWEIIESVLNKKDTLALLPTGGGKSICYQVPAMLMEGICIVVSPLVALMKDQVEKLNSLGISAAAIYSGMPQKEIKIVLGNCVQEQIKFLYVSPERIQTALFQDSLREMNLSLLAVDEAHCISQWGFDFRPEYQKISDISLVFPKVPILALTATATNKVIADIQQLLALKNPQIFTASFERKNLSYIVRETQSKELQIQQIVKGVKGSGLVYVRSRKRAEILADNLAQSGFNVSCYHAGLAHEIRNERQQLWINGQIKLLVCTSAFGMGIDKPDCRFVIHEEWPDSLEAYYQEAGRAGRDGKPAYCVLLFESNDQTQLIDRLQIQFPEQDFVKKVYDCICSIFQIQIGQSMPEAMPFDMEVLCHKLQSRESVIRPALKVLQQLNLIYLSDAFYEPSRCLFITTHEQIAMLSNPRFQNILNLLLRTYGGLFEYPVVISEQFIAKKLNQNIEQIKKDLNALHNLNIIDYKAQNQLAKLSLPIPRIQSNYIQFNKANYKKRKQLYELKLKEMLKYATTKTTCRSQLILAYFEEKNALKCGTCDVCRSQKQVPTSSEINWKQFLEKKLLGGPFSLVDLLTEIELHEQNQFKDFVRIMIDKNELQIDENGKLHF
jgi:ATP-dependent DNA helicase RecQ